jgi:hypothetical protein
MLAIGRLFSRHSQESSDHREIEIQKKSSVHQDAARFSILRVARDFTSAYGEIANPFYPNVHPGYLANQPAMTFQDIAERVVDVAQPMGAVIQY